MHDHLSTAQDRLLADMAEAARGPKRNGLFALWLLIRQCEGALPPAPLSDTAQARRLDGLERRLASLSLPAPLRRAFPGSVRELKTTHPNRVVVALRQMAAPTREALGATAGDIVLFASRASQRAMRAHRDRSPA
ncbi:MAG: hypothetical protein OER90_00025 [Gemmatimonadota bacterium]|nr:hypothetical protein [Gemmatimonadota bacterium]